MPSAPVERSSRLPFPPESVFAWYERPGALERLIPPWEHVRILERSGGLEDGARTVLRVGAPIGLRWVAQHRDYEANRQFVDEQVDGPFARWMHRHRFEPDGPDGRGCLMSDHIEYEPPLGPVGVVSDPLVIRPRLERMLDYRHELVRRDLETHAAYAARPRSRVAVTGATGLIGRALVPFLTTGGHPVVRLVRGRARGEDAAWDYTLGRIDAARLEGLDVAIHLAGENIAVRWTREHRRRILESRMIGTRFFAETLTRLRRPPRVLISASAIGIYGNRGDAVLTEESELPPATANFLVEVGREWEAATEPARAAGIRVVQVRFGLVLTPAGGVLGRMLPGFRVGLGGPLGGGHQWMSWIAMDDLLGIIHHVMMNESLEGPVNATAPNPVTGREFATTLGRVLDRPALVPVPAVGLKAAFGEMADVAILSSARVRPARVQASGYEFRYPELEPALRYVLGRKAEKAESP